MFDNITPEVTNNSVQQPVDDISGQSYQNLPNPFELPKEVLQQVFNDDGSSSVEPKSTEVSNDTQLNQTQEQTNQRDAFFQQRFDRLVSTLKKYGVEIDPKVDDYEPILEPMVKAYQYIQAMEKDPRIIVDLAKKVAPDAFSQNPEDPLDYIKPILDKEFGEDFKYDPNEALVVGSPSWKYNIRANQLAMQYETQKVEAQRKAEIERIQQEENMKRFFVDGIKEVEQKYNIPPQKAVQYLKLVYNPEVWTVERMVNIGRLLAGEYKVIPTNTSNLSAPRSPASIQGGPPETGDREFKEFMGMI